MADECSAQFCEHIDNALRIIQENNDVFINNVIDSLCEDIWCWDSNTEISRKYLKPLKGRPKEDVINGLEDVKSKYLKFGNPFFHEWR